MLNSQLFGVRRGRIAFVIFAITCCAASENPASQRSGGFVGTANTGPFAAVGDLKTLVDQAIPLGVVTRDVRRDKSALLTGRISPAIIIIRREEDSDPYYEGLPDEIATIVITAVVDIDEALDTGPTGRQSPSSVRHFLVSLAELESLARSRKSDSRAFFGVFVFGARGRLIWYAQDDLSRNSIRDAHLVAVTLARAVNDPATMANRGLLPQSPTPDVNDNRSPTDRPTVLPAPKRTQPPLPAVTPAPRTSTPTNAQTPRASDLKGLVQPCLADSAANRPKSTKLSTVATSGKHKAVLLSFWATWCAPCVTEMPELAEIARIYEQQLTYVGLMTESCANASAKMAKLLPPELKNSQYELLDAAAAKQLFPTKELRHRGDIPLPLFALFDETGKLVMTLEGSIMIASNQRRLRAELDRLKEGPR